MNCNNVQKSFDDYTGGRLQCDCVREIDTHLENCPACSSFYKDIGQLRNILRHAELPVLPERIKLRIHPFGGQTAHIVRWTAAAAMLLLTFGLGFIVAVNIRQDQSVQLESPRITRTIVLAVESPNDRQGVTLRLLLPPGVDVEGHPGKTVIEWQDDLAMGVNRLHVPLILSAETQGVLTTQIEHQGKIQELKVRIGHLTDDQSSTQTGDKSPRRTT